MKKGKLKSVIDRHYSFEQMADAHRYVEIGHKKGDVAIKVGHDREL
ncbi:zinc-binding dehydrogenase [Paenibacillus elgii]|nr:zinc-binding dehydrogenase [Paenibacillus elgii]MCM3270172.1 zinc-binding dehydrogenase [Paenibacillus elgii]